MPTYGYRCNECANDFDVWQRMSDEAGAACPACGAASTRQFFPAGIVFKGSGFYKTDSRESSGSKAGGTPVATTPGTDAAAPKDSAAAEGRSPTVASPAPAKDAPASSSATNPAPAAPPAPKSSG